mmetsp:Transcript_18839/g.31533  ORF Transcript_18839/g.31533 Transcript_18839/m.31533 type:complete len:290 (-) Transcript_18839:55-924(-)
MFREADRTDRALHASYYQRPVPDFQKITQAAHLDDRAAKEHRTEKTIADSMPDAVPTTFDTFYDPDHPDADWTGQVKRDNAQKKHVNDHSSLRIGIEQSENGIISRETRKEFSHRRPPPGGGAGKNASSFEIAGVGANEVERFKTEYHRLACGESTTRDQLTFEKRQNPVKKIADPAQARSLTQQMQMQEGGEFIYGAPSPSSIGSSSYNNRNTSHNNHKKSAYSSASASSSSSRSMLADIGSRIADKITMEAPKNTAGAQADTRFSKNRLLISENHHPFPGYTGGRKA